MELNNYQKQVMRDLSAYLNCVNRGTNLFSAWREYWVFQGCGRWPRRSTVL